MHEHAGGLRRAGESRSPLAHDRSLWRTVSRGTSGPGRALEAPVRSAWESRLGHDLTRVRVHTDPAAAEAATAIGAHAYTVGSHIVFARGRYQPDTSTGGRLLAHELTHVVQESGGGRPASGLGLASPDDPRERQADRVADTVTAHGRVGRGPAAAAAGLGPVSGSVPGLVLRQQDAGPVDAGVSLPGGVPEPEVQPAVAVDLLTDDELGALLSADPDADAGTDGRAAEAEEEIDRRTDQLTDRLRLVATIGIGSSGTAPGTTLVTPEVGLKILDNVSRGEAPFKPELGKGGCSWFVTEGSPYAGIDAAKNVPVQVEISATADRLVFKEADLVKILAEEAKNSAPEAEATFRRNYGIPEGRPLSNRLRKSLARFARQFAESRMWTRVGERVAASASKVGEVVLEAGSIFSKTAGKFAVVADAAKIRLRGGVAGLVEALTRAGRQVEAPLVEAAEKLATRQRWAGRVRGVFRVGGRILIVVAIAQDVHKIYRAVDKVKAIVESAGGWAGATAGAAAFAAWFAPADVAGPWAWAAHGAGTLISGAVGYWIGSEVTRTIYELTVE